MTKEELNDWSASLRTSLAILSSLAGAFYGMVTLLFFGPMALGGPKDPGIVHLLISSVGPFALSLFVYHSILVRPLALPGAIVGAIYSYSRFHGPDLYFPLNLCGLTVVTLIVIGLIEARATTGALPDFWRSFLFHPLGWAAHFKIRTHVG